MRMEQLDKGLRVIVVTPGAVPRLCVCGVCGVVCVGMCVVWGHNKREHKLLCPLLTVLGCPSLVFLTLHRKDLLRPLIDCPCMTSGAMGTQ